MKHSYSFRGLQTGVVRLLALLGLCAGFCSSSAWAIVGYVHEASGDVRVQVGNGPAQPVQAGTTFDPGATFRTAGNGNVVLKFQDGQIASLRPNAAFRIDQYNFDPSRPSAGQATMSLLQGALRYVTGVLGATNRNAIRLNASTATIGIRGTDLVVDVTTFAILTAVLNGAAEYTVGGQTTTVPGGSFSSFTPGGQPTAPVSIAAAPAVVTAILNALRAAPIPINTPVVVASAARAAQAVAQARAAAAAAAANTGDAAAQKVAQDAATAAATAAQQAIQEAGVALQQAIAAGATAPANPSTGTTGTVPPVTAPSVEQLAPALVAPLGQPPSQVICGGSGC